MTNVHVDASSALQERHPALESGKTDEQHAYRM